MIKLGKIENEKHHAWDVIGSQFWKFGDDKVKPSPAMLEEYLLQVTPSDHCCIIGASTFDLIDKALQRGLNLTVLDFSEKMCTDLEEHLGSRKCNMILLDVLEDIPLNIHRKFTHIFSDRIINRFSVKETSKFLRSVAQLLRPDGELRTTVRMGLYDLDKKMIEYQKAHPEEKLIYDADHFTINFYHAQQALKEISPAMGKIPKKIVFAWYLNRGLESRYSDGIIKQILSISMQGKDEYFEITHKAPTPDTTPSIYYKLSLRKKA